MFEKFKPTDIKWALTKPNPTPTTQCTLGPPYPLGNLHDFLEKSRNMIIGKEYRGAFVCLGHRQGRLMNGRDFSTWYTGI